jgi:hypothetical protein
MIVPRLLKIGFAGARFQTAKIILPALPKVKSDWLLARALKYTRNTGKAL